MDALRIEKAILGGFDWGARTANIIAALWPERVKAIVSVSGYLIGSQESGKAPLPAGAELQWWYQYYFATERGGAGYDKYRHDFSKLIWQLASPCWNFDDATFDRSAASFNKPDHVDIVTTIVGGSDWLVATRIQRSGQRARHGSADLGSKDRAGGRRPWHATPGCQQIFLGKYTHRVITGGIGHNLPQEAPQAFVDTTLDVDTF